MSHGRLTSDSPANIAKKLLKLGVKYHLLIEKYIDINALKKDTICILENAAVNMSRESNLRLGWDKYQELLHDLVSLWYPEITDEMDKGNLGWTDVGELDLELRDILSSEGYMEVDE